MLVHEGADMLTCINHTTHRVAHACRTSAASSPFIAIRLRARVRVIVRGHLQRGHLPWPLLTRWSAQSKMPREFLPPPSLFYPPAAVKEVEKRSATFDGHQIQNRDGKRNRFVLYGHCDIPVLQACFHDLAYERRTTFYSRCRA